MADEVGRPQAYRALADAIGRGDPAAAEQAAALADWSAAAFYYSIVNCAEQGSELFLRGLQRESNQGDVKIVEIGEFFGIETVYTEEGIRIRKVRAEARSTLFSFDFSHCPDLAQAVMVMCAAAGVKAEPVDGDARGAAGRRGPHHPEKLALVQRWRQGDTDAAGAERLRPVVVVGKNGGIEREFGAVAADGVVSPAADLALAPI